MLRELLCRVCGKRELVEVVIEHQTTEKGGETVEATSTAITFAVPVPQSGWIMDRIPAPDGFQRRGHYCPRCKSAAYRGSPPADGSKPDRDRSGS